MTTIRPSTTGSVYAADLVPAWLQDSAERTTATGLTIPASVAVHHEHAAGVAVVLTFADRDALRQYAERLLDLAAETWIPGGRIQASEAPGR